MRWSVGLAASSIGYFGSGIQPSKDSSLTTLWLIIGLVALTFGAEWLVRGASQLALRIGISPLVVGLTVVAFGTSAPEMVVSVGAAVKGQTDVSVGNVVGSNICNMLLILGLTATITPLAVDRQLVRFDLPLLILVTLVASALCLDTNLSRWEGIGLFCGLLAYTSWSIIASRKKTKQDAAAADAKAESESESENTLPPEVPSEIEPGLVGLLKNIFFLGAGLTLLILGANWFIDSAIVIARYFGVSELIIGLTLVAVGTSLPEVATSVVAAIRGERDIAAGNVIGSNMFNLLGVLGMTAAVAEDGIPVAIGVINRDILLMVVITLLCWPVFWSGHRIARLEGGIFLLLYLSYLAYLVYTGIPGAAEALPEVPVNELPIPDVELPNLIGRL